MKKTLTLQQEFISHINSKSKKEIISSLPYSNQESLARLNIYRNNVFGNFTSVLSSIYEVVQKLVGEKFFEQISEEFIKKYPSKSGNLDDYGFEFPQFLKRIQKKYKLPYLSDVAHLELLFHKAYLSKKTKDFDLEKFQKIAPQNFSNLTFFLHPSCFLFSSKFPVFSIWKNNIESKKPKKLSLNNPEMVLVNKGLGKVEIEKLNLEEFIFLKNLIAGKKLFETYKNIIRTTKKECDVGKILEKFIKSKVIINFKLEKK